MKNVPSPSLILNMTGQLRSEIVSLRRYFHQYPELSWEEANTAQVLHRRLTSIGLKVQKDVGGSGLVAQLDGELPGVTIAYRADMDALPIQDGLEADYASLSLGVKHACGHDAHMAVAFGVAKILYDLKGRLHGTIRFIFQPAEEALDGAHAMIANGALDEPTPKAVLALHTFPMPVGTVGLTPGCCLAGMEEFRIKFKAPETLLPSLIKMTLQGLGELSSQTPPTTVQASQELIHHMMKGDDPKNSVYISCWQNPDGFAGNADITGLVSMTDYTTRSHIRQRLKQALDAVIRGTGATFDLWTSFTNPPLINDSVLTRQIRPYVEDIVGKSNVVWFNAPYPFAHEDFALYAQQVPASLLWLGTANSDRGIHSILHTSNYDIDEDALVTGTAMVTYLLLKLSEQLSV